MKIHNGISFLPIEFRLLFMPDIEYSSSVKLTNSTDLLTSGQNNKRIQIPGILNDLLV
jgi:hypothetical protein